MTPEPLNDTDFESLTSVLQGFSGKRAMNVEQLDGFFAALACCPSDIAKTEYLPEIWGDDMINEDAFTAQPVLQQLLSLVARHKEAKSPIPWNPVASLPLCFCPTQKGYFAPTTGRVDSSGEWICEGKTGLSFSMTRIMAVRSFRSPPWRTSMTRIPRCAPIKSRSAVSEGKN